MNNLNELKPSEILRVGLDAMIACNADPNYVINKFTYHKRIHGKTYVCMGGAVMAKVLNAHTHNSYGPSEFPNSDDALRSLDTYINHAFEVYCIDRDVPIRATPKKLFKYRFKSKITKKFIKKTNQRIEFLKSIGH